MARAAISIINSFLAELDRRGLAVRNMSTLAQEFEESARPLVHRLGQAGRHVFFVSGVGFINVHGSANSPGLWGVDVSVKEDFDRLSSGDAFKCLYVFLVGRNDKFVADGYITADLSSPPFRHPIRETPSGFKINERADLDPSKKLLSVERLARALHEGYGQSQP